MSPAKPEPELYIDDNDRYSRLRLIGWWDQSRIAAAKVMVVGAGALGNEVLKNLALLGIGTVHLIDFDIIQDSNLSRSVLFRSHHQGQPKATVAAAAAIDINPDTKVIPYVADVLTGIGLGLVRDVDVVICCVDNREARLWINRMCWKVGTPWIDGGIQEINGVAKVFVPPAGSCYECTMTENDYRLISLRYSCPLLKQEDIQEGKVPTAPTIASIIGGLQVQEALKLLHGLPSAEGTGLVFNGAANQFYQTRFPRRDDCLSHETYEEPISVNLTAAAGTATDLFAAIAGSLPRSEGEVVADPGDEPGSAEQFILQLDRDFLVQFVCRSCDIQTPVNQPLATVRSSQGICEHCQQPQQPESVCEVAADSELADLSLKQLGIPDYDIVKVVSQEKVHYVLLDSERA